jgi:hypothetical protein
MSISQQSIRDRSKGIEPSAHHTLAHKKITRNVLAAIRSIFQINYIFYEFAMSQQVLSAASGKGFAMSAFKIVKLDSVKFEKKC